MTDTQMPKAYNPKESEEILYEWWEKEGFFRPETQSELGQVDPDATPFVISMPPPNVTGALHLGHAITSSVEDLLIRYNRMAGRPTLWVPGTDHAGIATQNVVERKLEEQGVTRQDLGRERFVREVWDWKDEYHSRISGQQR
ncbi:MAG: class I tRNA ligase family protein, partial [Caldilineaceae bacterium]|nr:class I tRNA ligase family protein [Caldilineaceae bacterium]